MRLSHHRAGSGEPLVLVHGIGSTWRVWTPVLPALEAERDVLAIDLPGFGESPRLPEDLEADVDALATGAEAEMDSAGFETAHVAGNSLGGWVALELARRGRARSVVALSPAGMWSPRERSYAEAALRFQYRTARAIAPHAERLTRIAPIRTLLFSGVCARPWRTDPAEAAYAIEALARSDFLPTLEAVLPTRPRELGTIRPPVTIAWGTRDTLLLPRQGPRFIREIPDAALVELPGLGHVPMPDDPDLVARTILEGTGGRRAS